MFIANFRQKLQSSNHNVKYALYKKQQHRPLNYTSQRTTMESVKKIADLKALMRIAGRSFLD